MAKATAIMICPVCGAEVKWSVEKHNHAEADNFESYYNGKKRLCPECYKKSLQEEREKEAARNADAFQELCEKYHIVLPALEGSEKQVKWAEDIRSEKLLALEKVGLRYAEIFAGTFPGAEKIKSKVLLNPSARFWIDVRGDYDCKILADLIRKAIRS